MTSRPLPPACSPTDQILVAIHDRLGELLDRLPERPTAERPDGTVELTEPKRPNPPAKAAGRGGGKRASAGAGAPRPARRASKSDE